MINLKDFSKYPRIVYNTSKHFVKQNSPTILSAIAVGGVVSTAVLAGKGTLKARDLLHEAQSKKYDEVMKKYYADPDMPTPSGVELTALETLRIVGPCYAPAAIMGAATIGCILGANSINLRRQAALASLYSLSEATLKEYKEKTKEIVGEKKAQKIDDERVQDVINRNPASTDGIIKTIHGETIFYDTLSGRYFTSDIEFVRRVENDIKSMIFGGDMSASLNDFYYQVGLNGIGLGEDVGWNIENLIDLKFTGVLMSDGTPCIAIGHNAGPIYNYQRCYM